MRTLLGWSLVLCGLLVQSVHAQPLDVASPDGSLVVTFELDDGAPRYRVDRFGREVIRPSRLGFAFQDAPPLAEGFRVVSSDTSTFDETWTQPWGEQKDIRNHYRELRVALGEAAAPSRRMDVVFRVYDDGLGFRYEIPAQPGLDSLVIMDELTEFALAGDHEAWWIPAYWWNRYEYLYRNTPVSEIDTVHTPVTFETADGLFLSIHEAALVDYSSMTLARTDSTTLKADLVPWSDGVRVHTATPMRTPWRTIQIGDTAGDLITSYLILNLNEPNALGDVSWVRPGKYVGIWWGMHVGEWSWGSGPNHGATTERTKRYIDFAAEHGFDGVLVEGWNVGWDVDWVAEGEHFSFTEPHPDFDLEEVARYARERGVYLIGHHETGAAVFNYEAQMEDAFALYERLGVPAVKTGYVQHGQNVRWIDEDGRERREWHHGQFMVEHHQRVVDAAARHRIALNPHEPIKDTGLRRTYPNLMTREGARGQEYDAWGAEGGNPPDHTTILPFTRLLSGPMDYTPGAFDLRLDDDRPDNRVNTTLAKQLAHFVVLYSPLQMASDLVENYEARPDAFQFIKDVPADWAETVVLHGRIGDYVTIARKDRGSDDWYLGSITDDLGRVLEAPLYFLDPDRPYVAQIYRDGDDADWVTNPYAIVIEERLVDDGTLLPLRLAPGGGQAIRFRPASDEDVQRLSGGE